MICEEVEDTDLKCCSKCKEFLARSQFRKNVTKYDGLQSYCKTCAVEFNRSLQRTPRARASKDAYRNTKIGFLKSLQIQAQQRARKGGYEFSLPKDFLIELWDSQQGLCALTGLPMQHGRAEIRTTRANPYNASPDKIDPNKGYVVGNVRLTTFFANYMRGDSSDEEFAFHVACLHKSLNA